MAENSVEQKIDALTTIVEKGFTAVAEDIGDIRANMATKDEVREIVRAEVPGLVREEMREIRSEAASIRRDLDGIAESVVNIVGYRKEIDHALERISAIEKHLDINKKIAA